MEYMLWRGSGWRVFALGGMTGWTFQTPIQASGADRNDDPAKPCQQPDWSSSQFPAVHGVPRETNYAPGQYVSYRIPTPNIPYLSYCSVLTLGQGAEIKCFAQTLQSIQELVSVAVMRNVAQPWPQHETGLHDHAGKLAQLR